MEHLYKFIKLFKSLRTDRSHKSPAPHKPILLLSILQAVKNSLITSNKIFITPELIALFKFNWNDLVVSGHHCKFALPFFHMRSEKFWHLVPKPSNESAFELIKSVSSISQLDNLVDYAEIDEELFLLMKDKKHNELLRQFLLHEYFPVSEGNYHENIKTMDSVVAKIEYEILNTPSEVYASEIKKLIKEKKYEEIFIRGSLFKREIPKIYNNTCCISGLRIDATINISMIDACHIRPFSQSYDDTITNGISLCPNLHRAFDRGIISISTDYKVLVSKQFSESNSRYSIQQFLDKEILLPKEKKFRPALANLEWHNQRFNFTSKT